jgi:hypothetical protein
MKNRAERSDIIKIRSRDYGPRENGLGEREIIQKNPEIFVISPRTKYLSEDEGETKRERIRRQKNAS